MRLRVWSLASHSGLRIRCCYELWRRSQTRLRSSVAVAAAAAALIQALAWKLPYAEGVALKEEKGKKKKKKPWVCGAVPTAQDTRGQFCVSGPTPEPSAGGSRRGLRSGPGDGGGHDGKEGWEGQDTVTCVTREAGG